MANRKLSRQSGKFIHNPEVSRQSGNLPDKMETFQAIWKLSRQPGSFSDILETYHTIW